MPRLWHSFTSALNSCVTAPAGWPAAMAALYLRSNHNRALRGVVVCSRALGHAGRAGLLCWEGVGRFLGVGVMEPSERTCALAQRGLDLCSGYETDFCSAQ